MVTRKIRKTWYVSIRVPLTEDTEHYSRSSRTFASETAARQYAAAMIAEGFDVHAGTINPVLPKRIVAPSEIADWLAEAGDGSSG